MFELQGSKLSKMVTVGLTLVSQFFARHCLLTTTVLYYNCRQYQVKQASFLKLIFISIFVINVECT